METDRRTFTGLAVAGAAAALLPQRLMAQSGGTIEIPFKLTSSRVLISCKAGSSGPFDFVFDTGGAVGLIDMKLVEQLELKRVGQSRLALSVGTRNYPVYEVKDLIFGGQVRQPSAVFAGVENFAFGKGVRGSLAAGVLSSVTGELDYDTRTWRIHRGEEPDRTGWTRFDKAIVKAGNKEGSAFLFADAVIGGRTVRVGLDTGMPHALRLYGKTAEATGLWSAPRWTPVGPDGKGRLVRGAVTIAGAEVRDVPIALMEDPQWSVFPNGLAGLPLLQLFNMATHAGDEALYLRRNATPPRAFGRYNRAGIWLDRAEGGALVAVVGAGSPAERAGITPGDRIVGADFDDLIDLFQGPPESEVPLRLQTASGERDVILVLEDFL